MPVDSEHDQAEQGDQDRPPAGLPAAHKPEPRVDEREVDGRWKKGVSGNPVGRPAGRRNNATIIAESLFDAEAATLSRKAIELALDGNATALRLCLQRLLAPRRERPVGFTLPPIEKAGDIVAAMAAITEAVADGTLSPSDAYALSQTVDTFLRAIDAHDFEQRLQCLEAWRS